MTIDAFRSFPPPGSDPFGGIFGGLFARQCHLSAQDRFDPDLVRAQGHGVEFELDARQTRIEDEVTRNRSTSWSATTEVGVSLDGVAMTGPIAIAYQASMPAASATSATMRALNPFDADTLPVGTRVTLAGGDFAGTPFESAFRELAQANGVDDIADLRLVIVNTGDRGLRVMSGPAPVFEQPGQHGPGAPVLERGDFTTHTALLDPGHAADAAAFRHLALTGHLPDGTVGISETVLPGSIAGTVVDIASGEVNDVTWTHDEEGRPLRAEATLTWEPGSRGRDSDTVEASAQSGFRRDNELVGTGDHVGHVFAYRFVNGHGAVNMFPQDGNFNTSAYVRLENEWADWLGKGMDIEIRIELGPPGQVRPDQVIVDYEVIDPDSGAVVYDPQVTVFDNEAGQVFDRIARGDMDEMIANANEAP